ncbi:MAG TPA: methyltransferase domain-containing protein, partial [Rubrivivax sp.]|nr:methyltransferase domain-containing protein [Rubrivivax sp.]
LPRRSMSPATTPPIEALRIAAAALCSDPRLLALLQRLSGGRAHSAQLDGDDAGLIEALQRAASPQAAVSQCLNLALQWHAVARQVQQARLPAVPGIQQWLEFGSGHTHLARFVDPAHSDLKLTVCEAQARTRDFVARAFGAPVLTLPASAQAFAPSQRFDVIWAPRFFAQRPLGQWRPWLARLHSLLTPGGVLCVGLPAGLSRTELLSAWTEAPSPPLPWQHQAQGLARDLDLGLFFASPAEQPVEPWALRAGPQGWVDRTSFANGLWRIEGWAAVPAGGHPVSVRVRLGDHDHHCQPTLARPDVAAFLGDPNQSHCGWALDLPVPPRQAAAWVEVTASDSQGRMALLYAGPPASTAGADEPGDLHVYHRQIDLDQRTTLSVLAGLVPPGAQVLDLGTGSGVLGRQLHENQGCEVDGLTLSADEQAAARPWYRRLVVQDLEDPGWMQAFAGRQYDYIVCADVLEHLRQPELVLQACRSLLRPGGHLLVSIPNVSYAGMTVSLMHGDWNYGTEGLLDRTHLRFFTRRSFTRLLQAEGWRVERVEPIEMGWFLTEFWTPFDHLPPAVARYLLAQPDASTYQLVFAAQPAAQASQPLRPSVPALDPTVSVAVFVATLYAFAAQPDPVQTVRVLGRIGQHRQTLRFALAAGLAPDAVLRLDPADRPGLMHLHALTLRGADHQVVWQWRATRDGRQVLAAGRRHQIDLADAQAGAHHLLCHLQGDDPQIDLPLPSGVLAGGGPWVLEVDCGWPLSADYLALQDRLPQRREASVEIVLPVYGGLDVLQRCVASVLAAECRTPWHLTLIDDASPQPAVGAWLRELAREHPRISVLTNARNLGFVGTVNLGMRLAGRCDVVLLNSDTEVAGDWLDRLGQAAYGTARAGTVTPFSNNATICSYPRFCEDNLLPAGQSVASLDGLFARANAGRTLAIPTAVGFCMYIRRECLDEVGEFDAGTFGAGYGEENDFCVRASAAGWVHLHALDVFVFHAGAASFSESRHALQASALAAIRRLHPHYEDMVRGFVQRDPARPFREAVDALAAGQART